MAKSDAFENALVDFIFNSTALPTIDADLYLSLHTADPGEAGDQSTNEVATGAYTNYARVAVTRGSVGWTVTGDTAALTEDVSFAEGVAGDNATVTHMGIGTAATGAGLLLYSVALNTSQNVAEGVTPFADTNTAVTES